MGGPGSGIKGHRTARKSPYGPYWVGSRKPKWDPPSIKSVRRSTRKLLSSPLVRRGIKKLLRSGK